MTGRATSTWSLPILRLAMGLFLALWGVDKLVATEGATGIFSHFYGVDAGTPVVRAAGIGASIVVMAVSVVLVLEARGGRPAAAGGEP